MAIAARFSSFLSRRLRRLSSFARRSASSLASASTFRAALICSIAEGSSGAASESMLELEIVLGRSLPPPLRREASSSSESGSWIVGGRPKMSKPKTRMCFGARRRFFLRVRSPGFVCRESASASSESASRPWSSSGCARGGGMACSKALCGRGRGVGSSVSEGASAGLEGFKQGRQEEKAAWKESDHEKCTSAIVRGVEEDGMTRLRLCRKRTV